MPKLPENTRGLSNDILALVLIQARLESKLEVRNWVCKASLGLNLMLAAHYLFG